MLGLHLVWWLWFSQKPTIFQDAREGVERLIKALECKVFTSVNRGFRVLDNKMFKYVQVKNAFSYFYPKRKVLEDGVSTIPLDM